MIKESTMSNTQTPENQPPPPVESLGSSEKKNGEKFSHDSVRQYAKEYFENMLTSGEMQESSHMSFFAMEEMQRNLSMLSKCEKEWTEERLYTENFREATGIFLEELISFSKEHEGDERVDRFLGTIQQMFFSSSPNISSALDFRRHFDFSAKATRSKKLQPFIGGGIIGDLAYKIGWNYNPDAKTDGLLQGYNESSISERLDKLNLTEILGAELIGAGSSYNYGDKKLVKLLSKIKAENKNVFIGYYIDMVESRMRQEYEAPSRGPVHYSNDPGNARLWDSLTEEEMKRSGELQNIIKPSRALKRGEKFAQIADNVVAIVDHSNLPVEYAKVNLEDAEEHESKVSGTFLVNVKDALSDRKKGGSDIMFDRLVDMSNKNIFIPRDGIDDGNPEKLATIWEKFGNISKDEWKEYFELDDFRNEFRSKIEEFKRDQMKRAEERNFQATLKMFDTYKHEVPQVLGHINNPVINGAYEEFVEAYESGDHEYAFDKASHIAMGLKHADGSLLKLFDKAEDASEDEEIGSDIDTDSMSYKINLLAQEFTNLRDIHTAVWDECQTEINNYQNKLSEEFQEKIIKFNEIADKIEKDKDNILNGFEVELDSVIDGEGKDKREADFVVFNELIKGEGDVLKGFNVEDGELLFQHLYRPAMKQKIESEFGIKFNDLPFHYHVNFLRFLSERDEKDVEKIKEFLDQEDNEEDRINRVKSFLSLESGELSGEDIILIGESLKDDPKLVNKLFEVYASLVDQTNITKEELKSLFKSEKEVKDEEVNQISRMILNKANALLLNYVNLVKEGKEIDKDELLNELEGYKADLVLTASVWKSVDKSDLSFEDLEGVNFEVETIGRITSEGRVMSIVDEINQKETDEKHPFIPGANIRGVVSKYAHEASSEERQRVQEILEMIDIYRKNYVHKPKLQKKIVEGFISKLRTASEDTLVYSFKKDGQVLAFNRFDQLEGNRKYFGSFNVDPSLSGSAIGTALMRASLDREAENNEIEADCDPETLISSYYVERAGFVVNGVMPNYADTGETVFGIERKKENEQYEFRGMSHEELVAEHEQRFRGNVYRKDLPRMVLKFEKDSNELFESSEKLVNEEGYVMTRYFFDKGGKHAYCAFERGGN